MMILRTNALAKGFSGIRLSTVEFIVKFFNAGLVPVVPSQGSVGSSGDIVQLAHLTVAMMGKSRVMELETPPADADATGHLLQKFAFRCREPL